MASPLVAAARACDPAALAAALALTDVNLLDVDPIAGATALHWAAAASEAKHEVSDIAAGNDGESGTQRDVYQLTVDALTCVKLLIDEAGRRNMSQGGSLHARDWLEEIVSALDSDGRTPLHWAVGAHRHRAAEAILAARADWRACDKHGQTPLHVACFTGDVIMAYLLLLVDEEDELDRRRSSTTASSDTLAQMKDNGGRTALHLSAQSDHISLCELVLRHGAKINARDRGSGWTALHVAAAGGRVAMIEFLLKQDASGTIADNEGRLPIDVARDAGYSRAVAKLSVTQHALGRLPHKTKDFRWGAVAFFLVPYVLLAFHISQAPPMQFVATRDSTAPANIPGESAAPDFGKREVSGSSQVAWSGMIIAILLLGAVTMAIRWLKKLTWPGHGGGNPAWTCGFWSAYLTSFVVAVRYDLLTLTEHSSIVFFALNCVQFVLFYLCLTTDPGWLPIEAITLNDLRYHLAAGEELPPICATCISPKPLRSKHCSECNRCVARMDHHCAWLNRCVGVHTHRAFFLLICMIPLLHLSFVGALVRVCAGQPPWSSLETGLAGALAQGWFEHRALVVLAIFHALFSFWETLVLFVQIRAVMRNLTTNEVVNFQRYGFASNGNPYDKGTLANVKEFVLGFPNVDWFNEFGGGV